MIDVFGVINIEDSIHDISWHVDEPSEAKGVVWSSVAAFAHTFSYNYDYLAFFIEQRNSNFGWYHPGERHRYIPLPTPTKSEFLEILEFRISELNRVLEGTTSASELYEKLKQEGEVAAYRQEKKRWNVWHWPLEWGRIKWNSSIACGDFFYENDPVEYIRLKERLNDTETAIKVYQKLATFSEEAVWRLMAVAGERNTAIRDITQRTKEAEFLTLCDPYLFNTPRSMTDKEYVNELLSVLPVSTLKEIDIFHGGTQNSKCETEFKSQLQKHDINVHVFFTKSIHDRVWIIDQSNAFIIGTSFNGLGKRIAFILDLPLQDLNEFKQYLDQIRKNVIFKHKRRTKQ